EKQLGRPVGVGDFGYQAAAVNWIVICVAIVLVSIRRHLAATVCRVSDLPNAISPLGYVWCRVGRVVIIVYMGIVPAGDAALLGIPPVSQQAAVVSKTLIGAVSQVMGKNLP